MEVYSPLRYPGGKRKIAPYLKQIFKDNDLCDGVYVEPYAGGASVALTLLLDGYASKILINDLDRSIYAFWYSILNETEDFCARIEKTSVTLKTWKKQMKLQHNKEEASLIDLGFSTFFLNRTNRSGILLGGVIGGIEQDGKWNMNARYNKKELIKRIRRIAEYRNRIEVRNQDAVKLLKSIGKILPKRSLVYLDPPYYVKGRALYLNYYRDEDHKKIFKELDNLKTKHWIVTYDYVKEIRGLYAKYRQKKFNLQYSACAASVGQELMIFSDNLRIPRRPVIVKHGADADV